ncbi:MAG: 2-C-methyl-D-erythritol 2,4-cyclodiphosphate synthase, partial [Acidobacteria bacterium]|nr:2-C-methyl-D-erythritol 2,4-cyclodiphosphate synthase [Acidobacteriota bacterium]
ALLGAAGLGDIGHYFPDSDPQWTDASSLKFLDTIRHLLAETGMHIVNVDSVVVLDQPKLAPYIPQIKESLAAALAVESAQVNVKAKTSEGLFPVSSPMAAAHAVVLLAI